MTRWRHSWTALSPSSKVPSRAVAGRPAESDQDDAVDLASAESRLGKLGQWAGGSLGIPSSPPEQQRQTSHRTLESLDRVCQFRQSPTRAQAFSEPSVNHYLELCASANNLGSVLGAGPSDQRSRRDADLWEGAQCVLDDVHDRYDQQCKTHGSHQPACIAEVHGRLKLGVLILESLLGVPQASERERADGTVRR